MVNASVATGLAAAFWWGTVDYMSRSQSERVGYYRTVIYSRMVTLMVVLIIVPMISPSLAFPVYPFLALIGAGVINFVAIIFPHRAFQRGVVSVVAPVVYTYPVVTALSGMGGAVAASHGLAFLKERLGPNQLLGIPLSLAGVFALLYPGG